MDFHRRFTFLVCAPAFEVEDLEGMRLSQIIIAIEKQGFQVVRARRIEDAEIAVQTDAAIGCMVVDWGKKGLEGKTAALINLMRRRGLEMPIVLLVRRKRFEDIPVEVLDYIDGYVFLAEETPEFIATNLVSRLKQYAETLKTPFFGALVDYGERGNQLWTCPGHNGGVFYNRSPIGRIFVDHLGQGVPRRPRQLRARAWRSPGPRGPGAQGAAGGRRDLRRREDLFRAQRHLVVEQDRVVGPGRPGRPCPVRPQQPQGGASRRAVHRRRHPGLSGDRPQPLWPDRPDHAEAFDEDRIREKIRTHPLVTDKDAWQRERPFRAAVIEECTYDGTIYDANRIVEKIGHLCDYILFDEAWAGFMKFHPLYAGRFAMGLTQLDANSPGIIATQSTHKQLASFSQASQIHVRDRHIKGQRRRVLHASTSPFYPLFASLDVGAQMMKGRSGEVLWDDTIRLGIELRKKVRAIRREFEDKEKDPARRWFFEAFVPDRVSLSDAHGTREVAWENVSTDDLATNARYWELAPGATWHGFTHVAPGRAITDPNKLILLTPGFDRETGAYADYGIPAWWRSICARTAWCRRRTTSIRCSSCSRPASRRARPARC
jgi:ornithine decarboxylase